MGVTHPIRYHKDRPSRPLRPQTLPQTPLLSSSMKTAKKRRPGSSATEKAIAFQTHLPRALKAIVIRQFSAASVWHKQKAVPATTATPVLKMKPAPRGYAQGRPSTAPMTPSARSGTANPKSGVPQSIPKRPVCMMTSVWPAQHAKAENASQEKVSSVPTTTNAHRTPAPPIPASVCSPPRTPNATMETPVQSQTTAKPVHALEARLNVRVKVPVQWESAAPKAGVRLFSWRVLAPTVLSAPSTTSVPTGNASVLQ